MLEPCKPCLAGLANAELIGAKDVAHLAAFLGGAGPKTRQHPAPRLLDVSSKALAAVAQCGTALQHCAEALRDDEEICMAAVQQNGRALRHASERQRSNRLVVDAAMENNTEALPYVLGELKEEWEQMLTQRWKEQGYHLQRRRAGQILNGMSERRLSIARTMTERRLSMRLSVPQ